VRLGCKEKGCLADFTCGEIVESNGKNRQGSKKIADFVISSAGQTLKLERSCPIRRRYNGNIHSATHRRSISDKRIDFIIQRSIKCPRCKTTWTLRPEGIGDSRHRANRLIILGFVLYMLGLSHRRIELFLQLPGSNASKSSAERDAAKGEQGRP
jgi:transposase-like protein